MNEMLVGKPNPRDELVLLEQGSNMHGWSDQRVKAAIENMIKGLNGRPCLWVGAPNRRTVSWKVEETLWNQLRKYASPRCAVFDSRYAPKRENGGALIDDGSPVSELKNCLRYAGSDGLHPTRAVYQQRAQNVADGAEALRIRIQSGDRGTANGTQSPRWDAHTGQPI